MFKKYTNMHFIYLYNNMKFVLYALLNFNVVYHYIFSAPNHFLHKLSPSMSQLKFQSFQSPFIVKALLLTKKVFFSSLPYLKHKIFTTLLKVCQVVYFADDLRPLAPFFSAFLFSFFDLSFFIQNFLQRIIQEREISQHPNQTSLCLLQFVLKSLGEHSVDQNSCISGYK